MLSPSWYPDLKQLRQFSVIALFGFGLLGALLRFRFELEAAPYAAWGLGVGTFLIGLIRPRGVLPMYTVMMAIAFPIGWLITNVFLRIMYFGIMTPAGFVSRMMGRDPLMLKRPKADSYWQDHKHRSDVAGYYRQA